MNTHTYIDTTARTPRTRGIRLMFGVFVALLFFIFSPSSAEAAIQFVGSTTANGTNATYNMSLTSLTGGIAAAPAQDDIIIVTNSFNGIADGNPGVASVGYTEVADLYVNDTRDANVSVSYIFATATPATSVNCNASAAAASSSVCTAMVFRGVSTTSPMDVTATTTASVQNNEDIDCPVITPVTPGAYVVCAGGAVGTSVSAAFATISGYTHSYRQADAGGAAASVMAYKAWTSGAENPAAFVLNMGTAAENSWGAVTMALRPYSQAITLSGTLYSDEGITPMTAGKTLKIAVGTSTVSVHSTTTTSGTGAWSFIVPQGNTIGTSTNIVVWVDGISTTTAVTFTKASSTNTTISGINLYQNRVIVRHEATTGTSTDISNMSFYDGDDDSDIRYIANSGTLTVKSGSELYIWAGKTFAPTSTVLINGNASSSLIDGSLRIMGTYTPFASTTIAGHLYTSSTSVFVHNGGWLLFSATSSGKYISHNATSSSLGNVRFTGNGNFVFLANNATTTQFTNLTATVTPPIGNLVVAGNFTQSGTLDYSQGGTLIFSSSTAQTISGTMTGTSTLADIVIRGASTKTFSNNASTSNLTIESGATMSAPAGLTVTGSVTNSGTFTSNGKMLYLTGASSTLSGTLTGSSALGQIEVKGVREFGNGTTTLGKIIDQTSGSDLGYAITSDQKYLYVTGYCDGCGALGGAAYYTTKLLKTTGAVVWATTTDRTSLSDIPYAITNDAESVYVTGLCTSCGSTGAEAFYTIKYRKSDAGFVWATTTDPTNGMDVPTAITQDHDHIYVSGMSRSGSYFDMYTIKYRKSDAGFMWATTTDLSSGFNDVIYGSTQDQDYLYVTGYCDCGSNGDGDGEYATVKYLKSTGARVWSSTTFLTFTSEIANAVIQDQDYVYVTGAGAEDDFGDTNYRTTKYLKSTGAEVWTTSENQSVSSGADVGVSLAQDSDYLYFLAQCDNCGSLGGYGFEIMKYLKSTGAEVTSVAIDPTANNDYSKSITADTDYLYITGYCTGCGNSGNEAYYTTKLLKSTLAQVDGDNIFRFTSNASTTGDFTITYPGDRATNTVYAPASLTIGGDFNQYDTFVHNSGIVTMASTSAQVMRGSFATATPLSSLVASAFGPKTFDIEGFAPVLESGYETHALTIDTINNVLYIGASAAGSIWRCELSTECDESSDFTSHFLGYSVISLVFDAAGGASGVLYAGTDTTGDILQCDVSATGGCLGSFTSVFTSGDETITALAIDPVNGTLYATGGVYGYVYACYTSSLCDESVDFYSTLDTSGGSLYALTIDPINRVLYVGSGPYGMVYACPLSSFCDESTDYTASYDTPSDYILSLTVDTANGVLYAGADGGVIYRCVLSTGCDTGGDFTTVYDTAANGIYALTIDTVNSVLYAGAAYSDGIVYRCDLITECDTASDFSILYDTPETGIYTLLVDQSNSVLYIGTNSAGSSVWSLYRCVLAAGCATSDIVIATNIAVESGSTLITPTNLSMSGNYTQNGTSTTGSTTSFYFTGSSAQTISGTLTATSALPSTVFTGAGVKTFSSNASTTGDFSIGTGSSVTAPSALTVGGDFTQSGAFTHNSGTVYLTGMGVTATGTMTGSSAFNSLTLPTEGGASNFITAFSDGGGYEHRALIIDTENRVLYLGGSGGGTKISRCLLSTGCDELSDFTTAYTTGESAVQAFAIDAASSTLYVGTQTNGILYRCLLSTGCDAGGDFTTAYDTSETSIWSLEVDTVNRVLYVASGANGILYRCLLSTGCDAGGDFTTAYDTTESEIFSLVIASSTLYMGTANNGILYRCLLSTGCDAGGDFTAAYDTPEGQIRTVAVDTSNNVLYVGTYSNGIIYRCPLSSDCDSAFDFTTAYDTDEVMINNIVVDRTSGLLYVGTGQGDTGKIFRCIISLGCDASNDFVEILDTIDTEPITTPDVVSLYVDPANSTLYAGTNWIGTIHRLGGGTTFGANASTSNLTITGKNLQAPARLSISGNFAQNGTFTAGSGTTTFNGTSAQTATGTLASTSSFYNLELTNGTASTTFNAPFRVANHFRATTPSAKIEFAKGATTTLNTVNVLGGAGTEVQLRSTTAGTKAGLSVGGAYSFTYADIKDSSATNTLGLLSATSYIDSGNNNGWNFPAGGVTALSSGSSQTFALGQSTTSISTITITDAVTPSVTAVNDIRIKIATSTVRMLWDTNDTTATFGGTASGKVANPVTYEGGGSVLVIPVNSDFSSADTLTVSGLSVSRFTAINSALSALAVYMGGLSDVVADAADDKTVTITGPLTLANHDSGQASDVFTTNSSTGVNFFRYKLTPSGEDATISSTVFSLTGIDGIAQGDLSNLALYRDMNSNGAYDAGDVQVGGAGVASISDQSGSITFSSSYSATTSQNFILTGDYANAGPGNRMTIKLETGNVTATGATTGGTIPLGGSVTQRQHVRSGGGSSGGNGESLGPIGGEAPTSTPQGGGGGGGGGSTGGNAPTSTPVGGGGGGGGGEVSIPSSHFFASAYMAIGDSLISLMRHLFGW